MAGPPNLRFKGTLKKVQLGSVEYCERNDSLCVGYDFAEEEETNNNTSAVKFNQAPTGATVIGRMMNLVQIVDSETGRLTTKNKAAQLSASELRVFWVFAMTKCPVALQNATAKIIKIRRRLETTMITLSRYMVG